LLDIPFSDLLAIWDHGAVYCDNIEITFREDTRRCCINAVTVRKFETVINPNAYASRGFAGRKPDVETGYSR
jgi:hypothetical protein